MTVTEAQKEITEQGFSLGDVVRIHEPKFKAGEVIAQSPSSPAEAASGRKIDLLVQDGANASGVITVPDVNRMTEKEAREVITAAGLKIQGVDRVYSPLLPEGLAIETRPGTGSTMRAGQGVILKLATQRRPAGFMDADSTKTSTANGTARRVTSNRDNDSGKDSDKNQPQQTQAAKPQQAEKTPTAPSQPEEFTGDDYLKASAAPAQESRKSSAAPAAAKTSEPAKNSQPSSSGGNKTARIRYLVPPIGRPMNLRIEVTDPSGKRNIVNRQVKGGENVNATANYSQECLITIYLDGQLVWQERKD